MAFVSSRAVRGRVMMNAMRLLAAAVVVVVVSAAVTFFVTGRAAGPIVTIIQPTSTIGRDTSLEATIESPGGRLASLQVSIEQGGKTTPLFDLASPTGAAVQQDSADRIRLTRPIGNRALPSLQEGAARLVITASRPVAFGLRRVSTTARVDLRAHFTPPRVSVVSTHHFVNHGGAELVIYRVTPPESTSGVRVGNAAFGGFPASGLGVTSADPSLKAAFFALLHDQDLATPIEIVARDDAGNEGRAALEARVFPRVFRKGSIDVSDAFLAQTVPDIAMHTPELGPVPAAPDELLTAFLAANRSLRQANADRIQSLVAQSADRATWDGPFVQLGNSKVESGFADRRTYFYRGREIDRQVHLGFDLAVTAKVPVAAGNTGKVVFADYLGIYGNTVILDHGMGVQSLYAHLSSISVKVGDTVIKGAELGRSGSTGLAGGDHLHFAVLVGGYPVSPVEWWDAHWIEDRITRKVREASQ